MRKKQTPEGNISQERNRALSNTDERRHTQGRPGEDAASALDTRRREEPAAGKMEQPEEHATPHVADSDDRLSANVTPESNRDTPGDDEFAAVASAQQGADEASTSCGEIMSKDPVCCAPSDTVDIVARLMVTEDVGAIPVVHDLRESLLIGIVTDRDLVIKVIAEGHDPKTVTVGEVMTQEPVSCRADSNVHAALDAMAEHQLRRIPIVDENHRLVGIIAQADVAARLARPAETARVVEEISQANVEHSAAS
jgi:CBS domain-containing protein